MKYIIKHSNIAALMTVNGDDYVLLNDDHISAGVNSPEFTTLPSGVQMIIHNQFAEVFNLPLKDRQAWIDKQETIQVEYKD